MFSKNKNWYLINKHDKDIYLNYLHQSLTMSTDLIQVKHQWLTKDVSSLFFICNNILFLVTQTSNLYFFYTHKRLHEPQSSNIIQSN